MGFFSDLKQDFSQAVGDLLPSDDLIEEPIESIIPEEEITEPAVKKRKQEPVVNRFMEEELEISEPVQEELEELNPMDIPETVEQPAMDDLASLLDRMDPEPELEPIRPMIEPAVAPAPVVSDEVSTVTSGMYLRGDVSSNGSLDVMGIIEGDIAILGKLNVSGTISGASKAAEVYAENAKITGDITSQGSVKIGQSSVVIGNIYATSAVIAGAVKGDIDVHGPVILDTTAIVMGDVKSKSVQINNGAVIEGMCSQCYAEVNPSSFFEELRKKK